MSLLTSSATRWHAQCMGVWTYSPPGHHDGMPSAWMSEPTHLQCPTVARWVHRCEPTHLQWTVMTCPVHGCEPTHLQCTVVTCPVNGCEPTHLQCTAVTCPVHGCEPTHLQCTMVTRPVHGCEPTHLQCPTVARPVHWCEAIFSGVHLVDAGALLDHRLEFPNISELHCVVNTRVLRVSSGWNSSNAN